MCHESSGWELGETLGIGKGSVSLDDIHEADLVFVVGLNPGTNMPRMLSALEECKRNGGHVVAVNPLPEAGLIRFKNPQKVRGIIGRGTVIADQFLHIKPGGDLALFQAINALVLEAEDAAPGTVLDHEFIDTNTTGFAEFAEHAERLSWPDVLEATGLSRDDIEQVVKRVLATKKIIVCWAMGVTQQKYGVPTIREIVNFLMLRGALGHPGAGVCPVRGHSNVQGDRTMGIWSRCRNRSSTRCRMSSGSPHRPNTASTRSIRSGRCVMGGPSSSLVSQAISCARRQTATRPSRPCESAG
jgi:anaerobic selenocysteine-containing dehydrogenase